MDQDRLERIFADEVDAIAGPSGALQTKVDGISVYCISDSAHDRMRIVAPIARVKGLDPRLHEVLLRANFHSTRDARYAISEDVVFAAFLHPISSLSPELIVFGARTGRGSGEKLRHDLFEQHSRVFGAGFRSFGRLAMSERVYHVLFLCTGNSARSILAEATSRTNWAPRAFEASVPAAIRGEHLIGWRSRSWRNGATRRRICTARAGMSFTRPGAPKLDFVLTVCDTLSDRAVDGASDDMPARSGRANRSPAIGASRIPPPSKVRPTRCGPASNESTSS